MGRMSAVSQQRAIQRALGRAIISCVIILLCACEPAPPTTVEPIHNSNGPRFSDDLGLFLTEEVRLKVDTGTPVTEACWEVLNDRSHPAAARAVAVAWQS